MGSSVPERAPAPLDLEDLIVALLMPHAEADGRIFKLVVRMIQRGPVVPERLWLRARRERAAPVLYWLLAKVPEAERNENLRAVLAASPGPPRGYRGVQYNYDANRLLRRPATRESVWRAARR